MGRLSWMARGGVAWMLVHVIIYACWGGVGGDFGHRYLIGTYAAALVVFGETFLEQRNEGTAADAAPIVSNPPKFVGLTGLSALSAFWMVFLSLTYNTVPELGYFDEEVWRTPTGDQVMSVPYLTRLAQNVGDAEIYKRSAAASLAGGLYLSVVDPAPRGYEPFVLTGPKRAASAALAVVSFITFAGVLMRSVRRQRRAGTAFKMNST